MCVLSKVVSAKKDKPIPTSFGPSLFFVLMFDLGPFMEEESSCERRRSRTETEMGAEENITAAACVAPRRASASGSAGNSADVGREGA
jgi:hypothetical protein